MDFKQLTALGGIISQELVSKEIEFTRPRLPEEGDGDPVKQSATIHIRKRNSADFLSIVKAQAEDQPFIAIFRCVCTEDGSPLFPSMAEAGQLAEWLLIPMIAAVNEVNSFAPKHSPLRTNSGMKSPSPSAVARSKSGSRRSRKKSEPTG